MQMKTERYRESDRGTVLLAVVIVLVVIAAASAVMLQRSANNVREYRQEQRKTKSKLAADSALTFALDKLNKDLLENVDPGEIGNQAGGKVVLKGTGIHTSDHAEMSANKATDRMDNDGDGVIDNEPSETYHGASYRVEIREWSTTNGVDDDGDGVTDEADEAPVTSNEDPFKKVGDTIVPTKPVRLRVTVLGSAITFGPNGDNVPVTARVRVGGQWFEPWGTYDYTKSKDGDLNDGSGVLSGNPYVWEPGFVIPPNTPVSVAASSWTKDWEWTPSGWEVTWKELIEAKVPGNPTNDGKDNDNDGKVDEPDEAPDNQQIMMLQDQDDPITGTGFGGQTDPAEFLVVPPDQDGLDNNDNGKVDEPAEASMSMNLASPCNSQGERQKRSIVKDPKEIDGIDNDGDGTVDECDERDDDPSNDHVSLDRGQAVSYFELGVKNPSSNAFDSQDLVSFIELIPPSSSNTVTKRRFTVEVVASYGNFTTELETVVTAELSPEQTYGLYGTRDVSLKPNFVIDSYDSKKGSYSSQVSGSKNGVSYAGSEGNVGTGRRNAPHYGALSAKPNTTIMGGVHFFSKNFSPGVYVDGFSKKFNSTNHKAPNFQPKPAPKLFTGPQTSYDGASTITGNFHYDSLNISKGSSLTVGKGSNIVIGGDFDAGTSGGGGGGPGGPGGGGGPGGPGGPGNSTDITIHGPTTIVVQEDFDLGTNVNVEVDVTEGDVEMFVNGTYEMSPNSSLVAVDRNASHPDVTRGFRLNVHGSVNVSSSNQDSAKFRGLLYAPGADVEIKPNTEIYGALIGKNVDIKPSAASGGIHYDRAQQENCEVWNCAFFARPVSHWISETRAGPVTE
jgi:hypothetical protein